MKRINPINISIFLLISSSLILLVFFMKLSKFYILSDNDINLEITNGIGTFFGGIIGTLFSLIGSLLIYETIRVNRIDKTFDMYLNLFLRNIERIDNKIIVFNLNDKKGYDLIADMFVEVAIQNFDEHKKFDEKINYFISIKKELDDFSLDICLSSKLLKIITEKYKDDKERTEFFKNITNTTFEDFFVGFMNNFNLMYNFYFENKIKTPNDYPVDITKLAQIENNFKNILININVNPK